MQTNIISATQRPNCRRSVRARRPLSARVELTFDGQTYMGWTINASAGGLRIIIEDGVLPSRAFVAIRVQGTEFKLDRNARVAWTKCVQGGSIAGLALD
jgi:hypothetical protein